MTLESGCFIWFPRSVVGKLLNVAFGGKDLTLTTISKEAEATRTAVISQDFGELTLAFTDQFTFC